MVLEDGGIVLGTNLIDDHGPINCPKQSQGFSFDVMRRMYCNGDRWATCLHATDVKVKENQAGITEA